MDDLAIKIAEAQMLSRGASEQASSLVSSLHLHLAGDRTVRLAEILALDERRVEILPDADYPQVGVRGFGQGLFAKGPVVGSQTTYKAFNRLYDGAVVLSQVKGWEGAIGVCSAELAGRFVSPEYRTFRCIPDAAEPAYLATLVATPWFWERLKDATHGVGARRERTRPEQFLRLALPMPAWSSSSKPSLC